MKRIVSLLLAAVMLCALLASCGSENPVQVNTDYVKLPDHVTTDMYSADFWVKKDEKPWLSPDEIKAINTLNEKAIGINGEVYSLTELDEKLTADDLRAVLQELADSVEDKPGFLHGKPIDNEYWQEQIAKSNMDAVPDKLNIRYGFSVERASLRLFPCEDFIGETETDLFYDEMLMSEFLPYMPLIIAHESADHEWYFVYMYGFGGWVQKRYVATCANREDWDARRNPENFLVVTGRELRLNKDRGCEKLSNLLLPMGTVLPLVRPEDAPESIDGRYSYNSYIVKLPIRSGTGRILDKYALIASSEDVSVGYLPYTGKAVIELALKRLGDRYGWGGLDYSQDCSGMVREIYSCFGFFMPRTTWPQAEMQGSERVDFTDMTDAERLNVLKKLPAGTMLHFPGHVMLYLGMKDKRPYVISAVGSFCPESLEVGTVQSINSVVINDFYMRRRNGTSWLENLSCAVVFR